MIAPTGPPGVATRRSRRRCTAASPVRPPGMAPTPFGRNSIPTATNNTSAATDQARTSRPIRTTYPRLARDHNHRAHSEHRDDRSLCSTRRPPWQRDERRRPQPQRTGRSSRLRDSARFPRGRAVGWRRAGAVVAPSPSTLPTTDAATARTGAGDSGPGRCGSRASATATRSSSASSGPAGSTRFTAADPRDIALGRGVELARLPASKRSPVAVPHRVRVAQARPITARPRGEGAAGDPGHGILGRRRRGGARER